MIPHTDISDGLLRSKIREKKIHWAGHKKLKIYGVLHCSSGKRMKKENRVFFVSEEEALEYCFRPCGHCMKTAYKNWKKMDLFNSEPDKNKNRLPFDGIVQYYGKLFTKAEADQYYAVLFKTIDWRNDEALLFGKKITTKRKVAWYGEKPYEYTYSGVTKYALPWTKELLILKEHIEKETGETFNSCLLNLYHSGEEGMAWHSDGETDLKKDGAIGSLSFGAERKFAFKHKQTKEKVELFLEHGSLLVMKGTTQAHWLHRLPPTTKITTPRINLTFRTIVK